MIENELVKVSAGRLLTDILVNDVLAEPLEGDRVCERFAAALKSERHGRLADAESLAVYRANRYAPVLGVHSSQLGNVRGDLALGVRFAFPVKVFYVLRETGPVRDYELMSEGSRYQHQIRSYYPRTENNPS